MSSVTVRSHEAQHLPERKAFGVIVRRTLSKRQTKCSTPLGHPTVPVVSSANTENNCTLLILNKESGKTTFLLIVKNVGWCI